MPIWYKGIIPEHLAVRNGVGVFDVTHMGRVLVSGKEAEPFLNYVTTNNVSRLEPLSAHYSTMCNERGGIKDDFVLSRQEEDRFFMVYNASNRNKNFEWLSKQTPGFKVEIQDVSDSIAMFAVQGPKAQETLEKITVDDLSQIGRFKCEWTQLSSSNAFVSRTGYTGENGFEVFIWDTSIEDPRKAMEAWNTILMAGKDLSIEPCGLGARDTLRLEAGMCLYGNDIDEHTTPLEAGIGFAVKFKKGDFIGREALLKQKEDGVKRKRVGLKMLEKGIPRQGCEVFKDSEKVGLVTSGTFSPLLKCGIAMAYLTTENAVDGSKIDVRIRNRMMKAEICRFPFYNPDKFGFRRKE